MASSIPARRLLADSSSSSATSTMNLRPKKKQNSPKASSSTGTEFEVSAHEVPSGPNPISNRAPIPSLMFSN
ncbi:hypothetical protein F0562_002325 [Nyssa sinensis]|uniref:Uncharacterized protein n=1 Tax=Nyssa sinensis TaxID=561372 RepID=A0A5J5CAH6_9ASTE|nr:hypothetical protein F0562_002325 [Nyssa sinensis]